MAVTVADLVAGLDPARPETMAALDAHGFLVCSDDTVETYRERLLKIAAAGDELNGQLERDGSVTLFETFTVTTADRIPAEIMVDAARITWNLYRFSIDWVPGFFLKKGIGLLWGGCAVTDPETFSSIFLIRHNFARRPRWFIYRRDELMSHELCHIARMVLDDRQYEEHFAYATATSRLRRYMGNCFQTKYDALFFLLPVLVLLVAESIRTFGGCGYPIWPFWLLALFYPTFLLVRNQLQRICFFKALLALSACGCRFPRAVLFRCGREEIATLAGFHRREAAALSSRVREWATSSLKWQVIVFRFFDNTDGESFAPSSHESEP